MSIARSTMREAWSAALAVAWLVGCAGGAEQGAEPVGSAPADAGSAARASPGAGDGLAGEADAAPAGADAPAPVAGDALAEPVHVESDPHCDPLVPSACILPWPSARWTAPSSVTATGVRLAVDDGSTWLTGPPLDPADYAHLDGFSPHTQIVFALDGRPVLDGVAGPDTIDRSLDPGHPTVVLDLDTGERLPHWVELDALADDPTHPLVFIRPATRLPPGHRIGVAVRGLRDGDGAAFAPSPAFAALRDGVPTDADSVERRRDGFEALFAALETAGVAREGLQLAWWFPVGTLDVIRADLVAMRNDAIERLGPEGLGCAVEDVTERDDGARVVHGTVTTPWYLDAPSPPAHLVRGDDGMPRMAGTQAVPFVAIVPPSVRAATAPVPVVAWGHGLFGDAESTVTSPDVVEVADEGGIVVAGTNWYGMSKPELGFLGGALADVGQFPMLADNVRQGIVNFLALTTTMAGACRLDPAFARDDGAPAIDPQRRYFVGGSQGAILGATYLAVAPDVVRGALIVGGANFSFMIERSIHYRTFGPLLAQAYPRRLETALLMVLSQHVWDAFEAASWIDVAARGGAGLEPTPFVYVVARNDAQVPNLASDLAARIAGLAAVQGSAWVPWGVDVVDPPVEGSAWVAVDLGDPPPPPGNVPPDEDFGGHYAAGFQPTVRALVGAFLETGVIPSLR